MSVTAQSRCRIWREIEVDCDIILFLPLLVVGFRMNVLYVGIINIFLVFFQSFHAINWNDDNFRK